MGWKRRIGAGLMTACALLAISCNRQDDFDPGEPTSSDITSDPPPEIDPRQESDLSPDKFTEIALAPIGLDYFDLNYVDEPFLFDSSDGHLYMATIEFAASWDEIAAKIEEHRSDTTTRISVEEKVLVFENEGNWYSLTQHNEEAGKTTINFQFNADQP